MMGGIRTNYIDSTFTGIRYGIVLITVSFLLLVFSETHSSDNGGNNSLMHTEENLNNDSGGNIKLNSTIETITDSNEILESQYLHVENESPIKTESKDSVIGIDYKDSL